MRNAAATAAQRKRVGPRGGILSVQLETLRAGKNHCVEGTDNTYWQGTACDLNRLREAVDALYV